jgi:hypothetical protein
MFSLARPWRTRATSALAASLVAGGVGLLALTGCSSGGSSGSTSSGGQAAGGSGAGAQPSWASSLGAGVTVSQPGSASPGHDSPAAAVAGEVAALNAKDTKTACDYYTPAFQAQCKGGGGSTSDLPTFAVTTFGYTAVNGDKALVGMTGNFCSSPNKGCFTNTDPASLFKDGKSFAQQWDAAQKSTSSEYSLTPVIQVGGKWYIYIAAHS